MRVILTKTYTALPLDKKEILRYAGCKGEDGQISALLDECIAEASGRLTFQARYCLLPCEIEGDNCNFFDFSVQSKHLALCLKDCQTAVVFCCSIGIEMDRLIAKYSRFSPTKGVLMQALGAERIEALCDVFCGDIAKEYNAKPRPRFSPGYGDLSLQTQNQMMRLIDLQKMGVGLNDSLLLSPSKTVTAFLGLDGTR